MTKVVPSSFCRERYEWRRLVCLPASCSAPPSSVMEEFHAAEVQTLLGEIDRLQTYAARLVVHNGEWSRAEPKGATLCTYMKKVTKPHEECRFIFSHPWPRVRVSRHEHAQTISSK